MIFPDAAEDGYSEEAATLLDTIVKRVGNAERARARAKVEAKAEAEAKRYPPPMTSAELKNTVFPPLAFLVDALIREGIPQTIDGDGGIGKSSVAVGMVIGRGAGKAIFGRNTIQGPGLFITHEDDHSDVQAMAQGYADYIGVDLADLPVEWWSLTSHDITLADVDDKGTWEPGPFYDELESRLKPGLFVVLDCRSDVVRMDESLREPPNTFYKTVLMPLCKRHGCTILVLCHPSKAAMADGSFYSGGTGNKSALRNKLVMKLEDPDDVRGPRILDVLKRNRGERLGAIRLTFDPLREIYVADDDERMQESRRDLYTLVLGAVLELLDKGLRVVATARGRSAEAYAPKDVAEYITRQRKPDKPVTKKNVETMLRQAVECGALEYVKGESKTKAGYRRGSIDPSSKRPDGDDSDGDDFEG